MQYAQGTTVGVDRTRAEIEKIICRYGADQFISGFEERRAFIMFRRDGRNVRFILPLPAIDDDCIISTPGGRFRPRGSRQHALEDETRRRWRALLMVIKAKLEAVASGITHFEEEFLAHIILPDGQTVGTWLAPQIATAYANGSMPRNLLALPAPDRNGGE